MSKKSKLSYEKKIAAINEYKSGQGSYANIASKYGIGTTSLREIVAVYESQGEEGLLPKNRNKRYSLELKKRSVIEYLSGQGSQQDICKKYKIFNRMQLRDWVKVYNGHKEFRNRSGSGTEIYMTKGRKTSQQERAEIVAFCIAHRNDYALTMQTYGVSYQQVYAWVRKYETKGIDGLVDGRGKVKPESEMTETDKLKAQIKILEAKNYDLEIENAFIKKLKELERGGR